MRPGPATRRAGLAPELLVVAAVLVTAAMLALAAGRPAPAAIALVALGALAVASAPRVGTDAGRARPAREPAVARPRRRARLAR